MPQSLDTQRLALYKDQILYAADQEQKATETFLANLEHKIFLK